MPTTHTESRPWHTLRPSEVEGELKTDLQRGLSPAEAERRLRTEGSNTLGEGESVSAWAIFLSQFSDLMVLVLLAAAGVSAALGESADAIAIVAVVVLNAVLGLVQEYRAERALQALQALSAPHCRAVRAGRSVELEATELVPGDVIRLEAGDRIPADARLVEAQALAVEEAALTGESVPTEKSGASIEKRDAPVADRGNMLYMGTMVARGRGTAVVTETGMETEIGRIAGLIQQKGQESTPLQRRLEELGRWLVLACLAVVAIVFTAGVLQGYPIYRMFLTAVSLAVAAIPEGLPAVVTVSLALGVQRMIRRNAIIRKLPAVETLGSATVICSDKTGTLTQNAMTVTEMWLPSGVVRVEGTGYDPRGRFVMGGRRARPEKVPGLTLALEIASLCNHAEFRPARDSGWGRWRGRLGRGRPGAERAGTHWGDPTELALLVVASKGGVDVDGVRDRRRSVAEIPFDSDRKRMTVVTKGKRGGDHFAYSKGAPDVLLARCNQIWDGHTVRPLTTADRKRIARTNQEMASRALRVLALAYKGPRPEGASGSPAQLASTWESGMVFVGLVGMMDPPRSEVADAIQLARRAGIRTKMVTGDHPATAAAIGKELALLDEGGEVLTGADLDNFTDDELVSRVSATHIFARVSPVHKVRIVRALRRSGEVVAMTGDGVNDAPALKEADIGVAMGQTGTDVSKEAAGMVLTDDNYASIVSAVEEGRGIYDNIRKVIRYLLACNVGEVLLMFLATLMGMPLPLLPLQILWMNLVTDGLPAIGLGMDPAVPDVMRRLPRRASASVFDGGLQAEILTRGVLIALASLAPFAMSLAGGVAGVAEARTLAFTTIVVSQLIYVFECRRDVASRSSPSLFGNLALWGAVAVSAAMQLAVLYWPPALMMLDTVPLSANEWLVVLVFGAGSGFLSAGLRGTWAGIRGRFGMVRVHRLQR